MGLFLKADVDKMKYHQQISDDIKNGKKIKVQINKKLQSVKIDYNKTAKKYYELAQSGDVKGVIDLVYPGSKWCPIFTVDGLEYKFTDVDKLQYSSKSGTGKKYTAAQITAHSENGVCIALAMKLHLNKFVLEDKAFKDMKAHCDLGKNGETLKNIESCYQFLKDNPVWFKSIDSASSEILKKCNFTKQHKFHRDSSFMNSIYDKFKELKAEVKNLKGFSFANDKWNPGDIWVSKDGKTYKTANDLPEYNEMLVIDFDKTETVGISLKKVGTDIKTKIYNHPAKDNTDKISYTFKETIRLKDKASAFTSKDAYVVAKDGTQVQIRTFDKKQNIQGEITGVNARHGKIGFNNILAVFNKMNKQIDIHSYEDFHKNGLIWSLGELHNVLKDAGYIGDIVKLNSQYTEKKKTPKGPKNDIDGIDYICSKYQAVKITNEIEKMKDSDKDIFITILFRYAQSLSIDEAFASSVFLKVY